MSSRSLRCIISASVCCLNFAILRFFLTLRQRMMSDSDVADVDIFSKFSVEIKTIFFTLSITFYLHYFVLSIINDNKVDNIDLIR